MQGRIKQPDAHGLALHDPEKLNEIFALHGQQPVQHRTAFFAAIGKDHLAHHGQAAGVKEHVFSAAQADAVGVEITRRLRIGRRVGIGANTDIGGIFGPFHQLLEGRIQQRLKHLRGPCQHLALGAVNRDLVTGLEHAAIRRGDLAFDQIEFHRRRAHNTRQAHAAPDHGGVAGDAAPFGQHRLGRMHPANILGRCLAAHQNTRLAPRGTGLRIIGVEHDLARCGTGAGGNTAPDQIALGARINLPVQQFGQGARLHPHQRFLARDDALVGQRHGDTHGSPRRPRHPHTVQNKQLSVRYHKFQLHLGAQFDPHQGRMLFQRLERFGGVFFKGRAAWITGQIHRVRIVLQRVTPL